MPASRQDLLAAMARAEPAPVTLDGLARACDCAVIDFIAVWHELLSEGLVYDAGDRLEGEVAYRLAPGKPPSPR